MLSTIIIEEEQVHKHLEAVRELAQRAQSVLPVHQMYLPEIWHRHFHSDGELDFNQKRGRGLFGVMTGVYNRVLFQIKEEDELVGAALFVEMRTKLAGESHERLILTFPGDSALVPYQDFITLAQNRELILQELLSASLEYAESRGALLFLGYIPDSSPNFALLQNLASQFQQHGRQCLAMPNRRRGGIYPWSIDAIVAQLQEMQRLVEENEKDLSIQVLLERLQQTNPMMLHFPRTRIALEEQLDKVMAAAGALPDVSKQLAAVYALLRPAEILYPYLVLPDSEEDYASQLSKGTRRYFRRYKKQFLEQGGDFEKIAGRDVTSQHIEDYLELHQMRWGRESAAVNDRTLAFHHDVCAAYAANGMLCLFFARFRGRRVAVHSCFDIGDRREGYFTGRNPDMDHLRAGRLLYMETILDAIRRGFKTYDLGYGDVSYQGGDVATPRIDSIAKGGVVFTDGYVTCPVCAPSRAGLLTGRYQQRFGFWDNIGPYRGSKERSCANT